MSSVKNEITMKFETSLYDLLKNYFKKENITKDKEEALYTNLMKHLTYSDKSEVNRRLKNTIPNNIQKDQKLRDRNHLIRLLEQLGVDPNYLIG